MGCGCSHGHGLWIRLRLGKRQSVPGRAPDEQVQPTTRVHQMAVCSMVLYTGERSDSVLARRLTKMIGDPLKSQVLC